MSDVPADLLTQVEARRLARRLNESGDVVEGHVNVAHTVPVSAWGGQEKGWAVSLVKAPDYRAE